MKRILVSALVMATCSAFALDLGKMKNKAAEDAKAKAAAKQQEATAQKDTAVAQSQNIVEVCKDELSSTGICKNNSTPDTMKTCLVAHKEQLSQGCKSSLGL